MLNSNSILYYPTIEFRDINWIKSALLIWDNVYRIVPNDYRPNDCDEIRYAIDKGKIKNITLEEIDLTDTYNKYKDFLENLSLIPDGLAEGYSKPERIHRDKIDARLYPVLEDLSKKYDAEWFELSPVLARGYMMYLSQTVAENRKFSRATDNADSWIMSAYMNERGNFSEFVYDTSAQGQYCSVELLDLIPTNINQVDLKKIIENADKTYDVRSEFRSIANGLLNDIASCNTNDGTYEVVEKYKKNLNNIKKEFKKSTDFNIIELGRSSLTVGVPTALTTFGALYTMSGEVSSKELFSSFSIGFVAAMADYNRIKTQNRGPELGTYLIDMDSSYKNMHGLNKGLEYRMDQFIND